MLAKFRAGISYAALAALLAGILLAGCRPGASQQSVAPSAQTQPTSQSTQQQPNSTTQQAGQPGQQPATRGTHPNVDKVIARAAVILGVSETDLSDAFDKAIANVKASQPAADQSQQGGQTTPEAKYIPGLPWSSQGGQQPQGVLVPNPKVQDVPFPQGQWGALNPTQGQGGAQGSKSGPSDMMKSVYSQIAATLNLSPDTVASAFKQAHSDLKQ